MWNLRQATNLSLNRSLSIHLFLSSRSLQVRTLQICSLRNVRRLCARPRRRSTSCRCLSLESSTLTRSLKRCVTEYTHRVCVCVCCKKNVYTCIHKHASMRAGALTHLNTSLKTAVSRLSGFEATDLCVCARVCKG